MLVGELFEYFPDICETEFEYHGEPYDMLPLCIEGMSSNFYQAVLDSDIKLIDFVNIPVKIVIDYHEVMDNYRRIVEIENGLISGDVTTELANKIVENAISTDPIIDFNSLYPNILDSPE